MMPAYFVLFLFCAFVVGYVVGRVDLLIVKLTNAPAPAANNFFAKVSRADTANPTQNLKSAVADIDTSVYVGRVATDNLQKVNNATIGKTTTTEDNIAQSVSKLSQLRAK